MHYPDQIDVQDCRQLAIEVDGLPLCGGATAAYTVRAALAGLSENEHRRLEQLRDAVGPEIGIIDSHFDDTPLLFGQLGFRTRGIAGEDLGETELRLVAISCPHRNTRLDRVDVQRYLDNGGVLLSSDRAIRLPGISTYVGGLPGRKPTRARLSLSNGEDPSDPPVWLDPGYLSIDPSTLRASGTVTLAHNSLTGEPLVVFVQTGSGGIIHSVPHWLQTPHPEFLTSVERRPLREVPRYRHIGNSFSGIKLGGFLAQRAMVELLIAGLLQVVKLEETAGQPRIEGGK